jgi:hypothetical protein
MAARRKRKGERISAKKVKHLDGRTETFHSLDSVPLAGWRLDTVLEGIDKVKEIFEGVISIREEVVDTLSIKQTTVSVDDRCFCYGYIWYNGRPYSTDKELVDNYTHWQEYGKKFITMFSMYVKWGLAIEIGTDIALFVNSYGVYPSFTEISMNCYQIELVYDWAED